MDSLELERLVSYEVGAGNGNPGLIQEPHTALTAELSLQPPKEGCLNLLKQRNDEQLNMVAHTFALRTSEVNSGELPGV